MTSTATEISLQTTSKSSAVTTLDDLYTLKTILPLLVIDAMLLVNYAATYAAMLSKRSRGDFKKIPYYLLIKALMWSDMGVLTSVALYMGARLSTTTDGRQHIMPYFWLYSATVGYFPGMILNWFLTLNRFAAIVFFAQYRLWFNWERARNMVAFAFVVGVSGAGVVNLLEYPVQHVMYMSMSGFTVVVFLMAYPACVVVSILRMRSNMAAQDRKKYVVEIKLLAQAIIIGFMLFVQEFLYQATAGALVYEIFYMLCGGFNPILYLSLDVKIRRAYFRLLGFKFIDRKVTVVQAKVHKISGRKLCF